MGIEFPISFTHSVLIRWNKVSLGFVNITEFATNFVVVFDFAKVYFFILRLLKECVSFS